MNSYIPHTPQDVEEMLRVLGFQDEEELFSDIPESLKCKKPLDLPEGKAEAEVMSELQRMANKNYSTDDLVNFMGAGAYDHLIPVMIDNLLSRGEYYTSYTPYQAEISQGTLQYIFEFQTMIANLTGMDLANASLYDNGTGSAEALLMATSVNRKKVVAVSEGVHPNTKEILETYLPLHGIEIRWIPLKDGLTDKEAAKDILDDDCGALLVQNPNFFGLLEDVESFADMAHEYKKCAMVLSGDPIALGILKRPGDQGVDVYIGEGQSLGVPMQFGGPYLGLMAVKKKFMRKLPGRIVGETVDEDGKRSYVLTLTAREQHIRREKATSNICSNQGLNVLAATIYLSAMGKEGLYQVAYQSAQKAHYAYEKLLETGKVKAKFDAPFFKEFVLEHEGDVGQWQDTALDNGFLAGVGLKQFDMGMDNAVLYAVTEKRTVDEIDELSRLLEVES